MSTSNKTKKWVAIFLVLFFVVTTVLSVYLTFDRDSAEAATISKYSNSKSDSPFFEETFESLVPANNKSIDRWFDTLPETTNTSNFCSLGTAAYDNINGKTVYVDAFYRDTTDSLKDPNYGQAMLIYDCIRYKVAHPNEEVYIDITSYRFSITASACLKRDSKQFGYMRSLFEEEYDDHGFVRIAFMLVEAARMGIHVNAIFHLPSYAVYQYSKTNSKGYEKRDEPTYYGYFTDALRVSCYSSYAAGKTVADFMNYRQVKWILDGGRNPSDMMHSKVCAVSAYRDYQDNDYFSGVFVTSANIDANNYLGRNGNGGAQSGMIVSNHDEIYKVVHNYVEMLKDNTEETDCARFRDKINRINTEQFDLYHSGREDEIDSSQQIVYLGSENDDVFEFFFSPFPGSVAMWNPEYNMYARFLMEMDASTGPIELVWGCPYYSTNETIANTTEDRIIEMFHRHANPQNVLYLHLDGFERGYEFGDLVVGKTIGYKYVGVKRYLHSKDMLLCYNKNGQRYYVILMSSCNFGTGSIYYQSNQTIIVKATEEIDHLPYDLYKSAITRGAL